MKVRLTHGGNVKLVEVDSVVALADNDTPMIVAVEFDDDNITMSHALEPNFNEVLEQLGIPDRVVRVEKLRITPLSNL